MFTVAVCMAFLACLQAQELQGHVSIILLGATGDLAKKYLWQGLFQLYLVLNPYTVEVPRNRFVLGAQRPWDKQKEDERG